MFRRIVWGGVILAGFVVFAILSSEISLAQVSPGGGIFRPGSSKNREKIEQIKRAMLKCAEKAVRKALKNGKSTAEAQAAAREAVDAILRKHGSKFSEYENRSLQRAADRTVKDIARRIIDAFNCKDWRELSLSRNLSGRNSREDIEKKIAGTTLFEDFRDIAKLKLQKPVIIFFYTKDESSEEGREQVKNCNLMRAHVIIDPDFEFSIINYLRFKVNTSKLSEPLKKKYGVETVPKMSIFDCTGNELYSFTNPKTKVKTLSKKLDKFIEKSRKAAEEAWKRKKEKEIEKKDKK